MVAEALKISNMFSNGEDLNRIKKVMQVYRKDFGSTLEHLRQNPDITAEFLSEVGHIPSQGEMLIE